MNPLSADFDRPRSRGKAAKKCISARTPCGLETKVINTGDAYATRHVCPVCEETIWRMSYGDWVQIKDTCVSRAESGHGCADMTTPSADMDGYDEWLTPRRA